MCVYEKVSTENELVKVLASRKGQRELQDETERRMDLKEHTRKQTPEKFEEPQQLR